MRKFILLGLLGCGVLAVASLYLNSSGANKASAWCMLLDFWACTLLKL